MTVIGLNPTNLCVRDQNATIAPARHIRDKIFKRTPIHASDSLNSLNFFSIYIHFGKIPFYPLYYRAINSLRYAAYLCSLEQSVNFDRYAILFMSSMVSVSLKVGLWLRSKRKKIRGKIKIYLKI